ncbi:hypothetical protein LJC54_01510 [Parabacteroides sp. OttesenSCG-928-J18]|nr:hypothetical protein [Parabacteroides sp. OttesenSCG-928-J18]
MLNQLAEHGRQQIALCVFSLCQNIFGYKVDERHLPLFEFVHPADFLFDFQRVGSSFGGTPAIHQTKRKQELLEWMTERIEGRG